MTALSTNPFVPISPTSAGGEAHQLTLDRYHEMIELGFLTENHQVELIFGQLINVMPVGKRHVDCVDTINLYFVLRYGKAYKCSPQNPVALLPTSEPEPDYAIIDRSTYQLRTGIAEAADVLLLVEVSDSTLDYDRTVKAAMYALAGIREYWIINLKRDQLEIHTDPIVEDALFNRVQRYGRDTTADSPFCGEVRVSDLLPD